MSASLSSESPLILQAVLISSIGSFVATRRCSGSLRSRCGVLLFPAMAMAKVYVGNLPATIPESAVEREFERFGRCRVWVARKPPGFV